MKRLLFLCLSISMSSRAHATTVMDLSGPELAAISDVIIHARVLSLSGHITEQARVFTDADLLVIEGLKGVPTGARLKLSYPGGTWRGLGTLVSGQVSLKEGRECVLYLQHAEAGDGYVLSGMRLGFYDVAPREYDGVRIARLSTAGLTLVRRERVLGRFETFIKPGRQISRPLGTVLEQIREDLSTAQRLSKSAILGGQR